MERPERQRREKRGRCSQWEAGSSGEGLGPGPPYLGRQGEEHGQQSQRHQQQHQQAPCAPYLLGQRRQRRHPRDRRSAARLPLSGGQGPKTPRGGEEPRGTAPAAPPGRQRVGGGGGQGAGKGPQGPHPADPHHARRSGLRWEMGRKPGGAEGLSTVTPVQTLRDRPRCCDPQMASSDGACSLF